jgi:putative hemolysin
MANEPSTTLPEQIEAPDEDMKIIVMDHLLIRDPDTGEIVRNQRG